MSIKSLFKHPERYNQSGVKNPATPAERAEAVFDRRVGSVVVQAHNWRRISLGLLITCIILTVGLVIQSLKSMVVPYVVTLDRNTGEVLRAGAFTGNDYKPQEPEIKYFIGQFIQNARNIGLDPVSYQTLQKRALAYLTQNAAQKYASVMQSEGHHKLFGKSTVVVHIVSIQKMPNSETSFQVRWTEEEVGITSGNKRTVPMTGIFSYTMLPVNDQDQMLLNPLGLYITDFSFSKDVTAESSVK